MTFDTCTTHDTPFPTARQMKAQFGRLIIVHRLFFRADSYARRLARSDCREPRDYQQR